MWTLTGSAIGEMMAGYELAKTPMMAVNSAKSFALAEAQRYGIAVLGNAFKGAKRVFHVDEMYEKRPVENLGPQARMIIGRYILTPDIFDVLQSIRPNKHTHTN